MRAVPHEMTDEEMELFGNKFQSICSTLDGMPAHLVTPLLLRLAVSTYLDMKGFTKTDDAIQLGYSLIADLTEILLTKTERHITESN